MSNIDYTNINSIEPASCFDEVKHGRGRPRKVINAVGAKLIEALASVMCTEERTRCSICTSRLRSTMRGPCRRNIRGMPITRRITSGTIRISITFTRDFCDPSSYFLSDLLP